MRCESKYHNTIGTAMSIMKSRNKKPPRLTMNWLFSSELVQIAIGNTFCASEHKKKFKNSDGTKLR